MQSCYRVLSDASAYWVAHASRKHSFGCFDAAEPIVCPNVRRERGPSRLQQRQARVDPEHANPGLRSDSHGGSDLLGLS